MVRFSIETRGRSVDVYYVTAPEGLTVWIASITGQGEGRSLDGVVFIDQFPLAGVKARVQIAVLEGVDWICGLVAKD